MAAGPEQALAKALAHGLRNGQEGPHRVQLRSTNSRRLKIKVVHSDTATKRKTATAEGSAIEYAVARVHAYKPPDRPQTCLKPFTKDQTQ